MSAWQDSKKWSDQFLPEIKRILGEYLIGEPPMEEDAERNTDLMVLKMSAVRIGCRVRSFGYLCNEKYRQQFTIRTSRPSGNKTELAKIIEGWGDFFFYGFDSSKGHLGPWVLGDMKVFRLWFNTYMLNNEGKMPGIEKPNKDGSSDFRAFKITDLPEEFVVARRFAKSDVAPNPAPPELQEESA